MGKVYSGHYTVALDNEVCRYEFSSVMGHNSPSWLLGMNYAGLFFEIF